MRAGNFTWICSLTLLFVVWAGAGIGDGVAYAENYPALAAPEGSPGAADNSKGVRHYSRGQNGEALEAFTNAVEADANLAEGHYNLGLALDKLGMHEEATEEFRKALDLAPDKPEITESGILKQHLGMK